MKKNIIILGGDGYLGWSLALAFAKRTNFNIIIVDNLIKKVWEKEVKAKSLVPYLSPEDKIRSYKKIFGKNNLSFEKADILDYGKVVKLIKKYKPETIINASQQPSAPFSMSSAKNAGVTFQNNLLGNLNALFAIAETDKNIKYIKLGSIGCYCGVDSNYIPEEKVDLSFTYKNKKRKVLNSWLPMYATDFYHQSKITDFLAEDLAVNVWNLKVATIQQSTIFGATIPENHPAKNSALSARFNYDSTFGTVINRFVCQYIAGEPLTVYGNGNQVTGIISLSDTVDNILKIAKMDLKPGKHLVINNFTNRLSINEIAKLITKGDKDAKISWIKNPRKESDTKLTKTVQSENIVHTNKEIEVELGRLVEFSQRYKNNVDKSLIMPNILWDRNPKKKHAKNRKKNLSQLRNSWTTEQAIV